MAPKDNVVIRLSTEGRDAAKAVAEERFEGNVSAAYRYLFSLGLAAHKAEGRTVPDVASR